MFRPERLERRSAPASRMPGSVATPARQQPPVGAALASKAATRGTPRASWPLVRAHEGFRDRVGDEPCDAIGPPPPHTCPAPSSAETQSSCQARVLESRLTATGSNGHLDPIEDARLALIPVNRAFKLALDGC